MANLSFRLSRALASGRADKGVPRDRAQILVGLLNKRAQAHRLGLRDQEQRLRDQILWALPVHPAGDEREPAAAD